MLKEVGDLRSKYKTLSETSVVVDVATRVASRKRLENLRKEWRARKRSTLNILEPILDQWPKSKKDLFEEIGIETDEDVGVVLPPP